MANHIGGIENDAGRFHEIIEYLTEGKLLPFCTLTKNSQSKQRVLSEFFNFPGQHIDLHYECLFLPCHFGSGLGNVRIIGNPRNDIKQRHVG